MSPDIGGWSSDPECNFGLEDTVLTSVSGFLESSNVFSARNFAKRDPFSIKDPCRRDLFSCLGNIPKNGKSWVDFRGVGGIKAHTAESCSLGLPSADKYDRSFISES